MIVNNMLKFTSNAFGGVLFGSTAVIITFPTITSFSGSLIDKMRVKDIDPINCGIAVSLLTGSYGAYIGGKTPGVLAFSTSASMGYNIIKHYR